MIGVAMMPDMTVDDQKIMLEELSFHKPEVEVITHVDLHINFITR
jgi:hypothetical protein